MKEEKSGFIDVNYLSLGGGIRGYSNCFPFMIFWDSLVFLELALVCLTEIFSSKDSTS